MMSDKKVELKNTLDFLNDLCDEPLESITELYDILYDISTRIYDYRKSRGWSQKKLADILGVSQAMVSKLESGEYNFSIELLWKISKKLGWNLIISFGCNVHDQPYSVIDYWENQENSRGNVDFDLAVG
jgi:transcriptional regulator with XRE-family HTH domain